MRPHVLSKDELLELAADIPYWDSNSHEHEAECLLATIRHEQSERAYMVTVLQRVLAASTWRDTHFSHQAFSEARAIVNAQLPKNFRYE